MTLKNDTRSGELRAANGRKGGRPSAHYLTTAPLLRQSRARPAWITGDQLAQLHQLYKQIGPDEWARYKYRHGLAGRSCFTAIEAEALIKSIQSSNPEVGSDDRYPRAA